MTGLLLLLVTSTGVGPNPTELAVQVAQSVQREPLVRAITQLQNVPGRSRVTGTRGATAARGWLVSTLARHGLRAERWAFAVDHPFDGGRRVVAENVVVRLGPSSGDALVLAAHLDTKAAEDAEDARSKGWRWREDPAPGADDDASGAAALLEVARALKAVEGQLRRPVVIAWTDAEELARIAPDGFMDNYGASALVGQLRARGWAVEAALAVDMLARPRTYGFLLRVYSDGRAASSRLADALALATARVAPRVVLDARVSPAFTYSDHGAFWADSKGGLLLIEDDFHHERYHRTTDVYAPSEPFYDVAQVEAAARAIAATAVLF